MIWLKNKKIVFFLNYVHLSSGLLEIWVPLLYLQATKAQNRLCCRHTQAMDVNGGQNQN